MQAWHGWSLDVRLALRTLRLRPGFAAVVLLTIAVGTGATTAVFGVVHGVLLRPLPYADADRVFYLWEGSAGGGRGWVSGPNYTDTRHNLQSFEHVAALTTGGFNATGPGGAERISGIEVTAEFFAALALDFAVGRGIRADEARSPVSRVVVISHALWQRQFGGAPDVLDRTLELDDAAFDIVGVLPAELGFPAGVDVWAPLDLESDDWKLRRGINWLNVIARLRPGVTIEAATQELDALGRALRTQNPELREDWSIASVPLSTQVLGSVRTPLFVLAGAVSLVLLAVCVNVAGLLLVRATARQRDVAIRRSLGGGHAQIARQALTEAMLLSVLGGALGMLLAHWAVRTLQFLAPTGTPRISEASASGVVLLFGLGVSLATGIVCGLVPALLSSSTDPRDTVRSDGNAGPVRGGRTRKALVAAQVALAVVLVAGAGHLVLTFRNLRAVDPGFPTGGLLTASLPLTESRYDGDAAVESFYTRLLERTRALPGVEEAGVVSLLPLSGNSMNFSFTLRDAGGLDEDDLVAGYQTASAGYFEAMRIPLRRGRAFRADEGAASEPVVIVDDAFVRQFFSNVDPLGQEILSVGDQWRRVVGVVGSIRRQTVRGDPTPQFYIPMGQDPRDVMRLVVRVAGGDPVALAPELRRIISEIDPAQPVASVTSMQSLFDSRLAQPRFTATVLAFFGAATLLLAMLAVYGTVSHMVERRTREMGIRMALGAGRSQVRRLVIGEGMTIAGTGLFAGLLLALPATRVLRGMLYGVEPFQLSIVAGVLVLLFMAVAVACWLPARRATRTDPAVSLRWQ